MIRNIILLLSGMVILLYACTKNSKDTDPGNPPPPPPNGEVVLTPYEIIEPLHFPRMIIPDDNQPTVEQIMLGRMLYYDDILSNNGLACASCHLQSKGFTADPLINGTTILPHVNLGWYNNFMWNGSEQGTLEDVMRFEAEEFFGTDLEKLNQSEKYRLLFKQYYKVDQITYKELSYALAQFTRTMISRDTKYDRFLKGVEQLSWDEMAGRNIFFSEKGDCFHCHINPIMTDNDFHNTGLDAVYQKEADKGLFLVTGKATDLGRFRTPNLRNVELRSSYMHDGRFTTLEEVVEFYNSGVHMVNNIDPIMTKPGKEFGLRLNEQEKYQLIAFLRTLTDVTFTSDTSLSNPH